MDFVYLYLNRPRTMYCININHILNIQTKKLRSNTEKSVTVPTLWQCIWWYQKIPRQTERQVVYREINEGMWNTPLAVLVRPLGHGDCDVLAGVANCHKQSDLSHACSDYPNTSQYVHCLLSNPPWLLLIIHISLFINMSLCYFLLCGDRHSKFSCRNVFGALEG